MLRAGLVRTRWWRIAIWLTAAVLTVATVTTRANAFEQLAFSNALYQRALAESRPIVINVHADWCTTCQAQDRVLEQLVADPRFDRLLMLMVDYDSQQHLMRFFGVPDRSTFVTIRGGVEVDRLIAVTNREGIEAFLLRAVE